MNTTAGATSMSTKVLNAKTTIPANMADDPEGRAAWEALMRHRRARRRKKLIRFGLIAVIMLLAIGIPIVMALLPKPEHNKSAGTATIERRPSKRSRRSSCSSSRHCAVTRFAQRVCAGSCASQRNRHHEAIFARGGTTRSCSGAARCGVA